MAQLRDFLVGLGAELGPLARDGLETGLDTGHGAAGVAGLTLQEVETCVLLEDGVWRPAGVARYILLDISSQDIFNLFLLKSSFNHQLVISVYGATCSQLSQ